MNKKVKTAVFPIGGLGTRFLPVTKAMPKEMLPIVDKPLIQYAFEEAVAAGIEKFIFITGRNKNVIANHFDHVYELQKVLEEKDKKEILALAKDWLPETCSIAFIRQRQPLGLGHAVLCAKKFLDQPFAVLLADEVFLSKKPVMQQMVEAYEELSGGNMIGVQEVERAKTKNYGVIEPIGEMNNNVVKIKSLVEKPEPEIAPSLLTIGGRYILEPEIFGYLEKQESGAGGEIQLTDSLNKMAKKTPTYGYNIQAKRFDCGSRRGFIEANLEFALNIPSMKNDVLKFSKRIIKEYDN